jgi:hypothetical protein
MEFFNIKAYVSKAHCSKILQTMIIGEENELFHTKGSNELL